MTKPKRYFMTVLPTEIPGIQDNFFESSDGELNEEPNDISLFLHFKNLLDELTRRGLDA